MRETAGDHVINIVDEGLTLEVSNANPELKKVLSVCIRS